MANPRRLYISSAGGVDDSPSSPSLPRRRSLRLLSLKRPASVSVAEAETRKKKKKKKKKKKLASPVMWSEEDELAVLKGLAEYREKTSDQLRFDWDGFYGFVRGSIVAKVSKEQLFSKIKKLKREFLAHLEKRDAGNHPNAQAFGFSMMIWGQNEANGDMENGEETFKKHAPKESHDDADELHAVRDAFETLMSQGLTECQNKLKLEKLMSLDTRKRQELSNEWKAISNEIAKLNVKKLRLATKLAEAATY